MRSEIIQLYEGREDISLTTYILQDSTELLPGAEKAGNAF